MLVSPDLRNIWLKLNYNLFLLFRYLWLDQEIQKGEEEDASPTAASDDRPTCFSRTGSEN